MSADRNTKIKSDQIADYTLLPTDLNATNSLTDNYVPSYDLATGKFTWIAVAGGVTQLSDLSDVGVTTPTNRNALMADGDSWESRALVEADISDLGSYLLNLVEDTTPQLGGDLDLNGFNIDFPSVANISDVKDEDNMASDSATMLATQQSIKAYVDNTVPDLSTSVDDFTIKYVNNKLKVADRIEYNIMLLAFYRAVDNSKSIFNLLDGFIDEYEDETGIDTGASTNERYNSTNDYYDPDRSAGDIDENTVLMLHCNGTDTSTSFPDASDSNHTVTAHGDAQVDTTNKKWGTGSAQFDGTGDYLTIPDSPDWDICGSNSDDWTIDLWVKHTSLTGYQDYVSQFEDVNNRWQLFSDMDYNMKFNYIKAGISHITTDWGGRITDTNWHHIALCKVGSAYGIYKDGTQVCWTSDSDTDTLTAPLYIGQHSDGTRYMQGYLDEIRIQHSNAFSASPNVGKTDTIDVPTGEYTAGATYNMTLISNSQTADASPSDARIVIFEEDDDAITLNVDIKGWISRDGGTTWSQVTLADEGNYEGSKRVLAGVVDISGQPSGTNIEYKIETLNTKDLKIHGTGVNWD